MEEPLEALIAEAWSQYSDLEDVKLVVKPSIPILFFGDSRLYVESALKVITVGLNPSLTEFPLDDPFVRFRGADSVHSGIHRGQQISEYLHALDNYFRCNPYRRWFSAFEPLLNGMQSSFYDGLPNTALHTDLCSPLATTPTWSRLGREAQLKFTSVGVPLWHRLVRHLQPDVILISIARKHVSAIDFPALRDWETIYTVKRKNPYHVTARQFEVVSGKKTLLVFGQAANTPFGTISNADKMMIGRYIGERVRGR